MDIARMARGLGTVAAGLVIGGAILFAQHTRAGSALAEGTGSTWDGAAEIGLPADPACAQRLARMSGPHGSPSDQEETVEPAAPSIPESASPTAMQMD
jgi:hypothetical protein